MPQNGYARRPKKLTSKQQLVMEFFMIGQTLTLINTDDNIYLTEHTEAQSYIELRDDNLFKGPPSRRPDKSGTMERH